MPWTKNLTSKPDNNSTVSRECFPYCDKSKACNHPLSKPDNHSTVDRECVPCYHKSEGSHHPTSKSLKSMPPSHIKVRQSLNSQLNVLPILSQGCHHPTSKSDNHILLQVGSISPSDIKVRQSLRVLRIIQTVPLSLLNVGCARKVFK